MKQLLLILLSLQIFQLSGQDFEFDYQEDYPRILKLTQDSNSELNYHSLHERFEAIDTTITDYEVLALLIGFTSDSEFKPYEYLQTEREIYALNAEGKVEEALAKSEKFLKRVPVSQAALIEKSYSHYKLEQQDEADKCSWKFQKIMAAMYHSGNGITPETAYFSLGPADGQNFIYKFMRADIGIMGSGSDENGNFVDILEMKWTDDSNQEQSRQLYFQIQHATNTMFGGMDFSVPKKKKKGKKKKPKKK